MTLDVLHVYMCVHVYALPMWFPKCVLVHDCLKECDCVRVEILYSHCVVCFATFGPLLIFRIVWSNASVSFDSINAWALTMEIITSKKAHSLRACLTFEIMIIIVII